MVGINDESLMEEANLKGQVELPTQWVEWAMVYTGARRPALDMDNSADLVCR